MICHVSNQAVTFPWLYKYRIFFFCARVRMYSLRIDQQSELEQLTSGLVCFPWVENRKWRTVNCLHGYWFAAMLKKDCRWCLSTVLSLKPELVSRRSQQYTTCISMKWCQLLMHQNGIDLAWMEGSFVLVLGGLPTESVMWPTWKSPMW